PGAASASLCLTAKRLRRGRGRAPPPTPFRILGCWFASRGELVGPLVSEPPGGGVLVNRLRHGAAVSVQRFPRRVDDERGTVGLGVGADRHYALQWASRFDRHERPGRAGH